MDNWKHGNERMRCITCMWFVEKEAVKPLCDEESPVAARGAIGRCRKHAPTMTGFPVVFGSDWCGDHKLDEAK